MKKFRFTLDAALQLRRRRVEAEEAQFRQIATALEAVAAAARQLTSDLREAEEDVSLTTAVEFQSLDGFRAASARRLRGFEAQSEAIRRDLAKQQERLVVARRDEELLLKLKAKARAQWQAAADKELQDIADEAYLSQWARAR